MRRGDPYTHRRDSCVSRLGRSLGLRGRRLADSGRGGESGLVTVCFGGRRADWPVAVGYFEFVEGEAGGHLLGWFFSRIMRLR